MPHLSTPLQSARTVVPPTQVAEQDQQPPVKVGHIPRSLLPANTAKVAPMESVATDPVAASSVSSPALSDAPQEKNTAGALELPTLPPDALRFLTSSHYKEQEAQITRAFGLSEDDVSFLHEMDQMALGGTIGVDGYIRAMRGEFPSWDNATREKFIGRLLAERFVPWGERLKPSAKAAAAEEGLVIPPAPYYAIYGEPLTYHEAAEEITKMIGIPFTPNMVNRLADLVKSRSKGVRVAEQAESQLMRSMDQGGLGLQPEQARATVIAMGDLLDRVEVKDGKEEGELGMGSRGEVPQSVLPRAVAEVTEHSVKEEQEDQAEIAAIAKVMPRAAHQRAEVLAQSVTAVMGVLTGKPEDSYLLRRLENIVSTRLRDVRSRNEVLSTLLRGEKVGGLGLGRAEAERLTQEIEAGYAEWHERIASEESLAREEQERAQAAKTEEQKKQEAREHAAWFAEKTRQQQAAVKKSTAPKVAPTPPGGHPLDVREKAREEQAFGTLVDVPPKTTGVEDFLASLAAPPPSARMSRQPFVSTAAAPTSKTAPVPKTAPVQVPPKPQQATVKISATSANAGGAIASARPRMDDVQAVSSGLVGPREELARLTLGAFRRLGKTPDSSADHVRNLVKLLQEQSFEKRVEGIRAWQESPLQRQYVRLVADAFSSGTPMKDLLAKKRTAGEDVPTEEELGVIVMLNGDLRL